MSQPAGHLRKLLTRPLRVAGLLTLSFALAAAGRTAWKIHRIVSADPQGRLLTAGEVAQAQKIFGDEIDYRRVRLHHAPAAGDLALTIGNDIYVEGYTGRVGEFFVPGARGGQLLAHELTHVWQNKKQDTGMFLLQIARTAPGRLMYFLFADDDNYKVGKEMKFAQGSEEQQAVMVGTYAAMQTNLASPVCDPRLGGDEQNGICRYSKNQASSLASRIRPALPLPGAT